MSSKDALKAVLGLVVPNRAPIVTTGTNKPVCELQRFLVRKQSSIWEEILLHFLDCVFACCEAREVLLAHQHHLDEDDDFVGVLLQCHETLVHQFAELLELL